MPLRLRLLPSPGATADDRRGPTTERAIELPDEASEIRIGRRPDVELPLPYPALSGLHARLRRAETGWQVEDLGSTNGTRVDGERLAPRQPHPLVPGAQIALGPVTLVFDGVAGAVMGAERTATIARRLVSDLFAGAQGLATPSLSIVTGVPAGPTLRLETVDRRYVAGRGETCELKLGSEEISREHAAFVRRWDGVVVTDLGSKNGVRVNDELVAERRLRDGDLIQIGPATVRFSDPADRYLRDFEARVEAGVVAAPAPAVPTAPLESAETDAPPADAAPIASVAPPEKPSAPPRGSSRTAIIVAAAVLIIVGAVVLTLAFGS